MKSTANTTIIIININCEERIARKGKCDEAISFYFGLRIFNFGFKIKSILCHSCFSRSSDCFNLHQTSSNATLTFPICLPLHYYITILLYHSPKQQLLRFPNPRNIEHKSKQYNRNYYFKNKQ